jgi:LysR family transcriptional regulator, glycine cleavage system transcriptional activator
MTRSVRRGGGSYQSATMPPLQMIRAFEAVARAGSMRRAAEDMGISHSALSRHVRNLQSWVGARLIVSGSRGSRLTREGAVYYDAISRAFQIIASATTDLKPGAASRTLRIWCMPGLATGWLTPRLTEMQQALPAIDLVLRAVDQLPDFAKGEADLMIGFAAAAAFPKGALPLVRPRMFPVVSPRWMRMNGQPQSLQELARQPLIHEESRQQWADWFEAAGVKITRPLKGPRLTDASLGLDAAIAGAGISLATRLTAADELARRSLVELFKTRVFLGSYFFWPSPAVQQLAATRRLYHWLTRRLRGSGKIDTTDDRLE